MHIELDICTHSHLHPIHLGLKEMEICLIPIGAQRVHNAWCWPGTEHSSTERVRVFNNVAMQDVVSFPISWKEELAVNRRHLGLLAGHE